MADHADSSRNFSAPICLLFIVSLYLHVALTCLAQNASPAPVVSAEAAITDLEKQTCVAWARRDVAALRQLLAEDFMLVVGARVSERDDALQFIQSQPLRSCSELTPQVHVLGDTAWAMGASVLAGDSSSEQWQAVDVWARRKESWQLVFRSSERLDPRAYVGQALDLMQKNSMNQAAVDWSALRKETLARAAGAEITADAYAAIRLALAGLGDHHSHLSLTPELAQLEGDRLGSRASSSKNNRPPAADEQVAYSPYVGRYEPEGHLHHFRGKIFARVVVPKCPLQAGPDFVRFETRLQQIIAELDAAHPAGWIVDLRGNVGGNMWPMLAGVGPLLGEGDHLGEFFTVQGHSVWFYRDGVAGERDGEQVEAYPGVEGKAYHLTALPPVAVLIDRSTGSSGEAIAVAFRGRPQTRFFGEHTQGVSTVNYPFQLIDGATMWITIGVQADRTGRQYTDGLAPDEEIPVGDKVPPEDQDRVLQAGLAWLAKFKS
jgi:carboxyl-terminal processing protease